MQVFKSAILYTFLSIVIAVPTAVGQTSQNISLVGRWAHGPCNDVFTNGNYAYKGNGSMVQILEISEPENPVLAGEILLPTTVGQIYVFNTFAYIIDRDNLLHIFDISNPSSAMDAGIFQLDFNVWHLIVQDNYAYIGNTSELRILDVSNPANISQLGILSDLELRDLDIDGDYLYGVGNNSFSIIDVSNPTNPFEAGFLNVNSYLIEIYGKYAFVISSNLLRVYSIADPINPLQIGSVNFPGNARDMCVAGNHVFLCDHYDDGSGYSYYIRAIYIGDPVNPYETETVKTAWNISDISENNGQLFVAAQSAGLHIFNAIEFTEYWDSNITSVCAVSAKGDYAYLAERGIPGTLRIYSVTDPANPTETGSCTFEEYAGDWMHAVTIKDQYAYVAYGQEGVHIIDISNPSAPYEVGMFRDFSECFDVDVDGNYAYVVGADHETWEDGLMIVDISDPANPVLVTTLGSPFSEGVKIREGYAYVSADSGLYIFDVSDPLNPSQVAVDYEPQRANDIVLIGAYAYLATDYGLYIYDISTPTNPVKTGYFNSGSTRCLDVNVNIAYLPLGNDRIQLIDISEPSNPTEFANLRITFPYYDIQTMSINGNYLYCAGDGDFRIFQTLDIHEIAQHRSANYSKDVTASGNFAFVANEANGLYIIDISNPSLPAEYGYLDTPGNARNVTLAGDHAYVADEDEGLRIINVSEPSVPFETGHIDTVTYNVEIKGNFAYLAGKSGMHIFDISIPTAPSQVGFFNAYGMISDMVISDDVAYLAGGSGNSYLIIVDISNPANPLEVNRHNVGGGNIVLDSQYVYIATGYYGLKIIDISDHQNLITAGSYSGTAGDIEIFGDYAAITAGLSGIKILNITDPTDLIEEGYFDIGYYPNSINLHEGHIYITDGSNGMFVLQERMPPANPINLVAGGGSPSPWQNSSVFELSWSNPGDLSGISQTKYKTGSPPASNADYEGLLAGSPPVQVEILEEGIHSIFLWLLDGAKNEDFNNYSTVTLRYDNSVSAPTNFIESNSLPNSTWQNSINLSTVYWTAPIDSTGIDMYYIYYGPNPNGNSVTDSSKITSYNLHIPEGISYFRVQPEDGVGNLGEWTTGFVFKYDTTNPEGTIASSSDTSAGNFIVSWSGGNDGSGSGLSGHFDVRYRRGSGDWIDWLSDYPGSNNVFTGGEVGYTYYFEAAARDSAGNIEEFTGQAECATFISSRLGSSLSDIEGEQSEFVEITFTILNPDSTPTDIKCEYSLTTNDPWHLATVDGKTTNILPDNYHGSITWNSYHDVPGIDVETVRFKITPSSISGAGLPAFTAPFHLDNNQAPDVFLDPIETEQNGNFLISYHLSDIENDTLSIICEYYNTGSQVWLDASTSGPLYNISDYDGNIEWQSAVDIPSALGYYFFRIRPFDKDPGDSDTISIYIDNVGAPDVLSISEFTEEQSGDLQIDYVLSDEEGDNINLLCEYSNTSGTQWSLATVSGMDTNISPPDYTGFVIWQSNIDLPGIDRNTVQFRITADDGHAGLPRETPVFHLDNNIPPTLQIDTVFSVQSGSIEISIHIDDSENDTIQITGEYKIGSESWKLIQTSTVQRFSETNYNSTFYWNSLRDLRFGEFSQVQIRLKPADNDSGASVSSNVFTIYNYAGDYTGDIEINMDDLLPFALAWRQQDVDKEIGPASGEAPLLIPQPDGIIDFEDLMVLMQQWNWSYEHSNSTSKPMETITDYSKSTLHLFLSETENHLFEPSQTLLRMTLRNNGNISSIRPHLVYINQSEFDQWSNKFADELVFGVDTSMSILGFHIEINYAPQIFSFSEIETKLFAEQHGILIKTEDRKNNRILLDAVVLESGKSLETFQGDFIKFKIDVTDDQNVPVTYLWKIFDESGIILTQGRSDFNVETYLVSPRNYFLYQNFPNPFNPITTIRYQLPVDGKVQLMVYNILGEKAQSLVDKNQNAGYYTYSWTVAQNNSINASGIYFIQLRVQGNDGSHFIDHKKVVFLK